MKSTRLLAALIAATLPLTAVLAEDTAKTETTDQKQEQSSDTTGMKGMDMGQMMSNSKDQDAELVQKMMSANDKEGMGMCRMMGCCDHDGKHSHHH